MNIKRYTDKDRRTVMNRIREELGPDAVVLSSKALAEGFSMVVATDYDVDQLDQVVGASNSGGRNRPIGKQSTAASARKAVPEADDGIIHLSRFEPQSAQVDQSQRRVHAALAEELANTPYISSRLEEMRPSAKGADYPERSNSNSHPGNQRSNPSNPPSEKLVTDLPSQLKKSTESDLEKTSETQRLDSLQAELAKLRSFLEEELPKVQEVRTKNLVQQAPKISSIDILRDKMERFGLSEALSLGLLNQIGRVTDSAKGWRQVMSLLRNQIRIPLIGPLEEGGVFALVGPSGSGKTTTLCKLAARYVMQGGRKNLAIISMDTQRFGAQEQIKRFAECLRIPVEVVPKIEDLPKVLDKFASKKLVLIDAAAPGPGNSPIGTLLTGFRNSGRRIESLLTIPSTQSNMVLDNLASSIEKHHIAGVILTKLDECLSLAPVIGLVVQNHWPVCFTTSGHKVPQDIETAEADQLMRMAVKMSKAASREKIKGGLASTGEKSSGEEIAALMEQGS